MADVTVKQIDEFDGAYAGVMKRARAGLGVRSFGMQVFDLPPNLKEGYPNHDHSEDGQEEVYTVLEGSVVLVSGGQQHELRPGVFARVGPTEKRTFRTGEQPVRLLALGGTPGSAYEVQEWTEEGGPEPAPPSD
jgi:uncharacterized cupin superfamily protein